MMSQVRPSPSPGPIWETLRVPADTPVESSEDELEDVEYELLSFTSRKRKEQEVDSDNNAKRPRFGMSQGVGVSNRGNEYNPPSGIKVTSREHPSPSITRAGRGTEANPAAGPSRLPNGASKNRGHADDPVPEHDAPTQTAALPITRTRKTARKSASGPFPKRLGRGTESNIASGSSRSQNAASERTRNVDFISATQARPSLTAHKSASHLPEQFDKNSVYPGATKTVKRTRAEKQRQDVASDDSSSSDALPFSPSAPAVPYSRKQPLGGSTKIAATQQATVGSSQFASASGSRKTSLSQPIKSGKPVVIDITSDGETPTFAISSRRPPKDILVISSDDDINPKGVRIQPISRKKPSSFKAPSREVIEILDSDDEPVLVSKVPGSKRDDPIGLADEIDHFASLVVQSPEDEILLPPPESASESAEEFDRAVQAPASDSDGPESRATLPTHSTDGIKTAADFNEVADDASFAVSPIPDVSSSKQPCSLPGDVPNELPHGENQSPQVQYPILSPECHTRAPSLPLSAHSQLEASPEPLGSTGSKLGQRTTLESLGKSRTSAHRSPEREMDRAMKRIGSRTSSISSPRPTHTQSLLGEIDMSNLKIAPDLDSPILPDRKMSLPLPTAAENPRSSSRRRPWSSGMDLAAAIMQASQNNNRKVPSRRASQMDGVPVTAKHQAVNGRQAIEEAIRESQFFINMVQKAVSEEPVQQTSSDQPGTGVIKSVSTCAADQDQPILIRSPPVSGQSRTETETLTLTVGSSIPIKGNVEQPALSDSGISLKGADPLREDAAQESDVELEYIDEPEENKGVQALPDVDMADQTGRDKNEDMHIDGFEMIQNDVTALSSPDLPEVTPPATSTSPQSRGSTPHWVTHSQIPRTTNIEGFTVLNWRDFRQDLTNFPPKYHIAKELPHALQDHINHLSEWTRNLPDMRTVFSASIQENTALDEPDAPPIQVENNVDDEPTPPWEFHYSNYMWHGEGVPAPDMENLVSCDCIGMCDPRSKTCACVRRQREAFDDANADFAYDNKGRLKELGYPVFECNDLCGCDDDCRNRVVQHGRTCSITLRKTENKGWGVFADQKKIYKGTFIGIYAGELLTDEEGEERGFKYNKLGKTYLFDIDFHHLRKDNNDWTSKYTVDAYHAGNFTRFLNHSCDPNCTLNPCYINEGNIEKPLLAVFARRDIEPGEELCFSYSGDPDDTDDEMDISNDGNSDRYDAVYATCYCGARNCKGRLFG